MGSYGFYESPFNKHSPKNLPSPKAVWELGPGDHVKEFESLILNHSPLTIEVIS